jgi:hypothetical protein
LVDSEKFINYYFLIEAREIVIFFYQKIIIWKNEKTPRILYLVQGYETSKTEIEYKGNVFLAFSEGIWTL